MTIPVTGSPDDPIPITQGSVYPIGLTLLATTKDTAGATVTYDLTGATVAIEVYRDTGRTEKAADGWTWTTTTPAATSGDPIVGYVTVPAAPGGFQAPGERPRLRAIVTRVGQPAQEWMLCYLEVQPRRGDG